MIDKLNTTRDLVIVLILGLLLWLILGSYDGFEILISYLESHEEYELDEVLLLLLILSPFLIVYALLRVKEAYHLNKELKQLNEKLEQRVQEELSKRKTNEALLIQQSKSAALGEMISNFTHQWRQPLNALSLVIQNIKFSFYGGNLNEENIEKSVNKATMLTNNMSKTIDDFRDFFKPNKIKVEFSLEKSIQKVISLVESSFSSSDINIIKDFPDYRINIYSYENELSQALLNIVNNAKDALIENSIKDSFIKIAFFEENSLIVIEITDNAEGIKKKNQAKIIEPYRG